MNRPTAREVAKAKQLLKRDRAARKADARKHAPRKIQSAGFPGKAERVAGQRDPRQKDADYLSWLHRGLPCVACAVEGVPTRGPIEAAHQKLAIAAKGWREGGLGPRIHDARCVPLCRPHHTEDRNACDRGQRQFWDRLGIGDGIADLCAELHQAFRSGFDGTAVIRRYATLARQAA